MPQAKEPKDYIIFPLDVPDLEQAQALIHELKDHVGLFKVGLQLFVKEGPAAVRAVKEAGGSAGVFLDLKFHDIPATVRGAQKSASALGVDMITVHCDEGRELLEAVVGESGGAQVLAVTVLTSLNQKDLKGLGFREEYQQDLGLLVLDRAKMAKAAGCAGVVCSAREAARVRREMGPHFLVVTPGIRPRWSLVEQDDQKRVTTPAEAIRNGADYMVIGRPIRQAPDRRQAARRVAREIEQALKERG